MNYRPGTTEIQFRRFEQTDIAFALEQTKREGWDATAPYFETFLAHDPEGAFIAMRDGQRAGLVTTTRYVASAWIGNLIVPPEFRKFSIGSQLMDHAIQHLEHQGIRSIRLEADPLGINIYRRLGFVDEFDSPRFRAENYEFGFPPSVEPLAESDLPEIEELDHNNFGDIRNRLLSLLFYNRSAAYKWKRSGRIAGYLFVQASFFGNRLGPWIAEDTDAAQDLLKAALSLTRPAPIIVAVPGVNTAGVHLLSKCGFRKTPSSLRMLRGPSAAFGSPQNVYGLAGGATG